MTAKELFALPGREITASIQIGTETYHGDRIASIKIERGLSNATYFEIGTAFSASADMELIDTEGFDPAILKGMEASVFFHISDPESPGTALTVPGGKFTLEEAERNGTVQIRISGFDAMTKADKFYDPDRVRYPATLQTIAVDLMRQVDIPYGWTSFPNSSILIQTKPQFYGMSCREVLADIAELAGGYAFVDAAGQLQIEGIGVSDLSVNPENTVKFTQDPTGVTIAGIQVLEQGSDPVQIGSEPFLHVVDNAFIQGDGTRFLAPLYNLLAGRTMAAGTLEFNGNPTGRINAAVKVEFLDRTMDMLAMKRSIRFKGGMREEWTCPPLAAEPQASRTGLVRNLIKTQAELRVLDEKIESRVTKTQILTDSEIRDALKGDPGTPGEPGEPGPPGQPGPAGQDATKEYVHWMFADDANGTNMSHYPEDKPYLGIGFPRPTPTPSRVPIDYYWNLFRGSANNAGLPARPDKWYWVKFADDRIGNGMSDSIDRKKYIGFSFLKDTPVKSNNPADYEWHALYASAVHVSTQPPSYPQEGDTWVDQSLTPPQMFIYTDGVWTKVNDLGDALLSLSDKVDKETLDQLLDSMKKSVLSEVSTKITQTNEAIDFRFNSAKTLIENVESNTNTRFEEQEKYIRFENGVIKLGEVGNPLSIEISNEKISFLYNGMELYFIADGKTYFRLGHFQEGFQIGDFNFGITTAGDLVVR